MVGHMLKFLSITSIASCSSGVAVGFGWQALVAFVNLGSCYVVGLPFGILLGWLQFGITVSSDVSFCWKDLHL